MAAKGTLTSAFNEFGVKPGNIRTAWSARSEDGQTVVVTLWQDGIRKRDGVLSYDSWDLEGSGKWVDNPSNWERLEHLKWARDNCDGQFRAVITIAEDTATFPRVIRDCFAKKNIWLQLDHLDESTGAFKARFLA